jgi:hypothetical protein
MRIGVHVVSFSFPGGPASIGPTLAAVGQAAEAAGVDNLSVMDHYSRLHRCAAGVPRGLSRTAVACNILH